MRLSRNAKTILAGLAALALVGLVAGFLRFKEFVDEDPRLCATCHRASPEFALWMGGTHRSVSCQRCHHSTPEQGLAMLRAFLAGQKPKGKHAEVEVGACAQCHFSHDPRWPQVGNSRGHRIHYQERGIACVRCHAASMHGFEPVAKKCEECHPRHAVGVEKMAALHCFACHEFLGSEQGLRPTRRDCMRCHTAQGIHAPMNEHGATHGAPMEMSCSACHRPHRPAGQTLAACAECHGSDAMAKGGLHAIPGHRTCLECHKPHTWTAEQADCLRCHPSGKAHAEGTACTTCHAFVGAPLPTFPTDEGGAR
ncbi:conserved hypothetical protein [Anaeromyxobacter dehalogenans 2CP-1]|uniref:Uncharacterized protein n=1 Tax=Anaeromyxobacter dehalogenans (strain ATCC BAA-258 / DSM 21875 / 2CP-1) TaxID=455488 RepID=B8J7Z3_ANAD2|nr:cytochrome c3 family protein [Anaeromyxobacter dehalogenans]ACL63485.1 conserved hypothetical protein [Anaeromyxobacter dehalogenans 2CP-1]